MKKICAFVLLAVLVVTSTFVYAADIDRAGFTESEVMKYVENAVVIRAGNFQCYANNYRERFDGARTDVIPFMESDSLYVPLKYMLDHYEISYVVCDDGSVSANLSGKTVVLSDSCGDGNIKRKNGDLYAECSYVASLVDVGCLVFDDTAIFSDRISSNTKISKSVQEKIKQHLAYNWKNVYLGSLGYATGIVIHPKNHHLRYLRTDVGGVYKFDENNNMWLNLLDSMPYEWRSMLSVSAIALDPNDENVIYCSCGVHEEKASDIIKSTDGGKSWERLGFTTKFTGQNGENRFAGEALCVDANNSDYVYAGAGKNGLYLSKNAGKTWSIVSSIPQNSGGVTFVYADESEVYSNRSKKVYVGVRNYGVYVSIDGGSSFSLMENSPTGPQRIYKSGNKLYLSSVGAAGDGGMFYYENGIWNDITPEELKTKNGVCAFVVDRDNNDTIICQGVPSYSNKKFRSLDGGKTWEDMGLTNNHCAFVQDYIESNGLWAPFGAGVHFIEDMYAETFNEYSRDKGIEELVCSKMVSMPTPEAPRLLQQCMDWGQIVVDRLDTLYSPVAAPQNALGAGIDFCEEDPHFVFRGGFNTRTIGIMSSSTDFGRTYSSTMWVEGAVPLDVAVSATKQENGYPIVMVYACDDTGAGGEGLYRSMDFGSSWEKIQENFIIGSDSWQMNSSMIESDRVDGKTFYCNDCGNIYVSTDGGVSWKKTLVTTRTLETYIASIPGVEGGVWVKDDNVIMASYDKGKSWQRLSGISDVICFGFGIGKNNDNIPAAYVYGKVGNEFGVFISDNLGKTWRRIDDEGSTPPNGIWAIAGDRLVYGRVFLSTAGNGTYYAEPIGVDDHPPVITLTTEATTEEMSVNYAVGTDSYAIEGFLDESGVVKVNGKETRTDGYNKFSAVVDLNEGMNNILIEAKDAAGNFAEPVTLKIRKIKDFLGISYDIVDDEIRTKESVVHITGNTGVPATIYAGSLSVKTDENNSFDLSYPVSQKEEKVEVYAIDMNGIKSDIKEYTITQDFEAPTVEFDTIAETVTSRNFLLKGILNEKGQIRFNGTTIETDENNRFVYPIKLRDGENVIKYQTRDTGKNASEPKYISIFCDSPELDTAHITANYVGDNFVFDGFVDEWDLKYGCDIDAMGKSNNMISFNVMYDENYLYVGANIIDDVICLKHDAPYQNDCIEIYIDSDYCNGGKKHDGWAQLLYPADANRIVENSIVKYTENGYSVEIRIPWSDFGINAKPGTVLGFELDMVDNDGNNANYTRESVACFYGDMDNYVFNKSYSELTLGGK